MAPIDVRCGFTVSPVKIRYVLHNAYVTGGTIRTVISQANALCADHDVEIASVYRSVETPAFDIDPRVRLVPLTDLRTDGSRRLTGRGKRHLRKFRRFRNRLPHGHDFRYRRMDPQVDLAIIRYFRRQEAGTVLVTTRPALNLLSAWFAPKRLIRVGQDHMNLATYKPGLRAEMVRAYPRLDAVSVLTGTDLADWQAALPGGARVEHIPNGIPAFTGLSGGPERPVLVAAGRLTPQKGYDMLVDAFTKVHARHPGWSLDIYGAGECKPDLEKQIAAYGLSGAVVLRGLTKDLPEHLSTAGMFVLSSRFEGLPMVLLEAMTLGVPAVAFDCPTGPAEIIDDGRTGLLVPPGDVGALADAICELIEDPERRTAMREAARAGSAPYSMPAVRARWEQLFTELTEARSPA